MSESDVLSAPLVVEYPFTRTVGPVQSAFFTGLREGVLVGVRMVDDGVMCPPVEYDPRTSEPLTELVEVGAAGEVTSWAWVSAPRTGNPLDTPFAWALIRLDGADTAMLHAVDAGSVDAMSTGMRVQVRWAAEREGAITDIACFEPESAA
ncbi:MAG TPA: OB-fold domain-containing protein [Acidimicrobiales bacterium]